VIKIETQVVAGINYRFHFLNDQKHMTMVVVWDQSWTNTRKVMSISSTISAE